MSAELSIIIPVYHSEKYLRETLRSVLAQTYKDFEVLLVDDGSPDQSLAICREFEAEDNRIHVFSKQNGGVSSARNYGLERAEGKYIAFLDGDDCIDAPMYERMIRALKKYSADIVGCRICKEQHYHPRRHKEEAGRFLISDMPREFLSKKGYFIDSSLNKVYRRECIADLRFDETISYSEDKLFVVGAFFRARRVVLLPDVFYHYIQHGDSLSWQDTYSVWEGNYRVNKKIYEMFQTNVGERTLRESAFRGYIKSIIALLRYDVKYRERDRYEQTLRQHRAEIAKFLRETSMPLGKRLEYLTYTKSWQLASFIHYYAKRRKG